MTREEKVTAVEACWPKWPQIYDATTDEMRDITQHDVDILMKISDRFFALVRKADEDRAVISEFAKRRRADNQ